MNKKSKIIIYSIVSLVLLTILFGTIDYIRVKNDKMSIFTIKGNVYKDGGTTEYYGLGYKVLKCNTLIGDKSVKIGFYNMKYSCNTNPSLIDNSDFKVIDEITICAQALEPIYEDDYFIYYFNCIRSEKTFVKFVDGTKMKVKDALKQNLITISQLQKKLEDTPNNKISIYKEAKFKIDVKKSDDCKVNTIVDKSMSFLYESLGYDLYSYCLDEINITLNSEKYTLKNALATGIITMDKIIEQMEYSSKYGQTLKNNYGDGRTIKYSTLKYSILKCNSFHNNIDYYIGKNNMEYEEFFCK